MPWPPYSSDDPVDDAVAPTGLLGGDLYGVRDVGQARAGADRRDPGLQRLLARRGQGEVGGRSGARHQRDRRVAVPPVDDRPAVDRQQVAVGEDLGVRRDAVHDLVVHRGADRRRVAVVAEERRHAAPVADDLLGQRVQLAGADPGRAAAETAASARATRAPATRIASISPGLFSSMSRPRQRARTARTPPRVPRVMDDRPSRPRQRVHEPREDLVDGADGVHAHQLRAVVVEQRSGLVAVDLLPVADDVLGVVAAPAAEQPLDDDLVGDGELDDRVEATRPARPAWRRARRPAGGCGESRRG